jgi:tRNA(fMet)-specific endonuclease VapC
LKYLLDTNVASDYLKGVPTVVNHVQNCHPGDIAISAVTVMELSYGAKRRNSSQLTQAVDAFIDAVSILPLDDISGKIAGELKATLESQGTAIALADCQIAAIARQHAMTLVSNDSDLHSIPDQTVIDWRQ